MFTNTCTKCGKVFKTKNPKRVVCPECLYPDRVPAASRPQRGPGGHAGSGRPSGGGFRRGPGGHGGGRPGGRPGGGGFRRGPGGPGGPRGGPRRGSGGGPKKLLVTKEQLAEIEKLYKEAMPLPNPDIHETIGEKLDLAPSKVFFGINLVRAKMKLPKLIYPKRKLAVSPEQLMAIESIYEPYLPMPPIGVHKIISKQLKIDEWRVHVAIGLIRKNRNLGRWNEEREDLPESMKEQLKKSKEEKEKKEKEAQKADTEELKPKKAESKEKDSKNSKDQENSETDPAQVSSSEES